jgi:undecaprenyl-phosphate 4-deoxy-4-formamido-L-arabinose transferase
VSVSVVIPCYRSAGTLPELFDRLDAVMRAGQTEYELILVVDGSPDDTWAVADTLARTHDPVRAILLARNYGQHNALLAGIREARHDVIVTMDDDLQHRPEEVPALLGALRDGVDVVYGNSREEEHSLFRNLASRAVKAGMARQGVSGARIISAFRAFRSYLRPAFDRVEGPDTSIDVCLSWASTRMVSVKVRMDKRAHGRSGYTFRKLVRHAINTMLGYSTRPLRLVTYLGLLVGIAGLVLFVRILQLYFLGQTTVAGFTTIAGLVAIFSSAQMIAIGVLGEYVGRIHLSGIGRPTYVIRTRTDRWHDAPADAYRGGTS